MFVYWIQQFEPCFRTANPDSDTQEASSANDETETTKDPGDDAESIHQSDKLSKLTNAFNLLSKEKARLEEAFVKDKKSMREEHEKKLAELGSTLEEMNTLNEKLESQISQLKLKVKEQQLSIDEQSETSSIMLKELQSLLAEERQTVSKQHSRISELEASLSHERSLKNEASKYQSRVGTLEKELLDLSHRLKTAEQRASETPPLINELQKELQEMRASHKLALLTEQNKAREAELRTMEVEKSSEERISNLESKLSDFTDTLSQYECARNENMSSINNLKERVAQLDLENALLSQAVGKNGDDDVNLSVDAIELELQRYKELYKVARAKAGLSVFEEPDSSSDSTAVHDKYKAELRQLKEEFERYKTRAQTLLKNKVRESESSELERLKGLVASLKKELGACNEKIVRLENQIEASESKHETQVRVLKKEHSMLLNRKESEHLTALKELEEALTGQRERMTELLAEKEKEIKELQHTFTPEKYSRRFVSSSNESIDKSPNQGSSFTEPPALSIQSSASGSSSNATLSLDMTSPSSSMPMHIRETISRKDAEIAQSRKERMEAQNLLKTVHESSMMKEMRMQEEIERLRNQIMEYRRREAREGSNVEYVKNVMHQFLLCTSHSAARSSMLDAILTALHFTPSEQAAVKKAQIVITGGAGWFGSWCWQT